MRSFQWMAFFLVLLPASSSAGPHPRYGGEVSIRGSGLSSEEASLLLPSALDRLRFCASFEGLYAFSRRGVVPKLLSAPLRLVQENATWYAYLDLPARLPIHDGTARPKDVKAWLEGLRARGLGHVLYPVALEGPEPSIQVTGHGLKVRLTHRAWGWPRMLARTEAVWVSPSGAGSGPFQSDFGPPSGLASFLPVGETASFFARHRNGRPYLDQISFATGGQDSSAGRNDVVFLAFGRDAVATAWRDRVQSWVDRDNLALRFVRSGQPAASLFGLPSSPSLHPQDQPLKQAEIQLEYDDDALVRLARRLQLVLSRRGLSTSIERVDHPTLRRRLAERRFQIALTRFHLPSPESSGRERLFDQAALLAALASAFGGSPSIRTHLFRVEEAPSEARVSAMEQAIFRELGLMPLVWLPSPGFAPEAMQGRLGGRPLPVRTMAEAVADPSHLFECELGELQLGSAP